MITDTLLSYEESMGLRFRKIRENFSKSLRCLDGLSGGERSVSSAPEDGSTDDGKKFQSPKLLEKFFKVQSIVRVFFFKVLDLKDNRWSPTHFSSIRRATLSRSVACEKRPGNTVPGSVKVVRGTERELKPVNGVGTRDGRANRYLALPQRLFVFTARRRGNYVKAYALPRTRTKKIQTGMVLKNDGGDRLVCLFNRVRREWVSIGGLKNCRRNDSEFRFALGEREREKLVHWTVRLKKKRTVGLRSSSGSEPDLEASLDVDCVVCVCV